jgi:hypothetical protein
MFDGIQEAELLSWLLGDWQDYGPPVCVIEGFNGIGKTSAARKVLKAWNGPGVLVSATEDPDLQSLLFTIAAKLEENGCAVVANQAQGDFRLGVLELLQRESLIIIDEFDAVLSSETRLPPRDMLTLVSDIGKRAGSGRLLIITAQSMALGDWLENSRTITMAPPVREEAERFLWTLLHTRGLLQEVPAEKFGDIVTWLGRNLRALEAFVACLRDDPLEELLDIDVEAWELRDQAAAPQVIERLESLLLRKVIGRLDPNALLLLEFLSIYRTTFTIEAIKSSTPQGTRPEIVKDALTSRFLLGHHGRQYFLNPVARQLSLARLSEEPRRKLRAHNLAADHYAKRIHPTSDRARIRAGADFVEARYHLLQAGRDSDFQELAADYRHLLLQNYRDLSELPTQPTAAAQLLATLMAALHDLNEGYNRLRAIVAKLLNARGRPGDNRLAYQQVRLATREVKDSDSWMLRLHLAAELDTARAVLALVDQALEALPSGAAASIIVRAAELLVSKREDEVAQEALNHGLSKLPIAHRQRLYSVSAFLLCKRRRNADAIALLLGGYQELRSAVQSSWRLFEQALFIAFGRRDKATISKIKTLIVELGANEHQPVLCDIVNYELQGKYLDGAKLAEKHADAYFAIAAQGAFCWLAAGQPIKASNILDRAVQFQPNMATWWLRGIIAASNGATEVYREAMSRACGKKLSDDADAPPDLWLRIWEQAPTWIGIYPAFYFPCLPAQLTGLAVDLEPPGVGMSAISMYPTHDFTLWRPLGNGEAQSFEALRYRAARRAVDEIEAKLAKLPKKSNERQSIYLLPDVSETIMQVAAAIMLDTARRVEGAEWAGAEMPEAKRWPDVATVTASPLMWRFIINELDRRTDTIDSI